MIRTCYLVIVSAALVAGCSEEAPADPFQDAGPTCQPPTHLRFESVNQGSRVEAGYNGVGAVLPSDGLAFTLEVTRCDDECRRCRIEGPVKNQDGLDNQRCFDEPWKTCLNEGDCQSGPCLFQSGAPFSTDIDCNTPFFFPVDAPNTAPVQGIFDLTTGGTEFEFFNSELRFDPTAPCPACENDLSPGDGEADGTCSTGSSRVGQSCDVAGVGLTITSFDCPPSAGYVVPFPFLPNSQSTTGVTWTMDASRPDCTDARFAGEQCWCGVCDNELVGCTSDAECGSGSCQGLTAPGLGSIPPTAHNNCVGGCDWDPATQRGTCVAAEPGPLAGEVVACFDEESLSSPGSAEFRDGTYDVTLAALSCFPPAGPGDDFFGFPGVFYTQARYRILPEFRDE